MYSFACGCIFVPYEIWIARNEIALRLIWGSPVGVSAFGSVDAGPTDLARMLLVEFALTYGNDWFVIRIELNVGALYRTRSLVITDTFDFRTLIKSSSELSAPYST